SRPHAASCPRFGKRLIRNCQQTLRRRMSGNSKPSNSASFVGRSLTKVFYSNDCLWDAVAVEYMPYVNGIDKNVGSQFSYCRSIEMGKVWITGPIQQSSGPDQHEREERDRASEHH